MLTDPAGLIRDFHDALKSFGIDLPPVTHQSLTAPHRPVPLPVGSCAVYVFSLSEAAGVRCPAGPGRVLKVGKVGPNSNTRFQSQHYNPNSATSTLAASLINGGLLWTYLGFTEPDVGEVGRWLMDNTDRDHFYLRAGDRDYLGDLERYVRGRHSPVFEGG